MGYEIGWFAPLRERLRFRSIPPVVPTPAAHPKVHAPRPAVESAPPTPPPDPPTKQVQKYTYTDGRVDTIETYTRPDPDAPKPSSGPVREDFYNPLQSQIQLRGKDR